jgi:putative tricarboxylic transport membrane protein
MGVMKSRPIRSAIAVAALAGSAIAGAGPVKMWAAEQWTPQHNVEFIVPTAAGSTMDLLARVIQKAWQEQKSVTVPITVEAKSGAGGAVAWTYVSRKEGDGHYIAISGPTLLANEILHVGDLSYRDITPIAQLFTEYTVFAVRADGPIKTGADLVQAMRSSKAPSIGVAPGFGGSNHVAFLKLAGAAKIDPNTLTMVPFRGANDSVTALLGGHIDVADATMSALAPFLHSGKLRAIAIAAPKRLDGEHSDIPTWREQGFDVVEGNWRGIIGPKNLSPSALAFWDRQVAQLVKSPEWADVLKRYQWDADYADSAASKRFLDHQYEELKATFAHLKASK